jgi:hypothetical protein
MQTRCLLQKREKCIFGKTEILYFEHILTSEGMKTQTKSEPFAKFPTLREWKSYSCYWINYLGKYIPNLSTSNYPLRTLLKEHITDSSFKWT